MKIFEVADSYFQRKTVEFIISLAIYHVSSNEYR